MSIEKELYIIRHGQTAYNAQGLVQGRGIDAPLNELGIQQAKAFYAVYGKMQFDALYSSTLLRAKQTLEPFKHLGVVHHVSPLLDEISWGEAEGSASFSDHSDLFKELLNEWRSGNVHYSLPGGESPFELQQRQMAFIQELQATSYKRVLIATHGRFIRAFMCTLTGKPLSEMETFEHNNLCLYVVHYLSDGTFSIAEHNNQHHLADLINRP